MALLLSLSALVHHFDGGHVDRDEHEVHAREERKQHSKPDSKQKSDDHLRVHRRPTNLEAIHNHEEGGDDASDRCPEAEQHEELSVAPTDTVVDPRAVMIHAKNTPIAGPAVMTPIWLRSIAQPTNCWLIVLHSIASPFRFVDGEVWGNMTRGREDAAKVADSQEEGDVIEEQRNGAHDDPVELIHLHPRNTNKNDVGVIGVAEESQNSKHRHEVRDS